MPGGASRMARIAEAANNLAADDAPPTSLTEATPVVGGGSVASEARAASQDKGLATEEAPLAGRSQTAAAAPGEVRGTHPEETPGDPA